MSEISFLENPIQILSTVAWSDPASLPVQRNKRARRGTLDEQSSKPEGSNVRTHFWAAETLAVPGERAAPRRVVARSNPPRMRLQQERKDVRTRQSLR